MKQLQQEIIIFSVFNKDSSHNELNYIMETKELTKKGIEFKTIISYNKGERELAIMIYGIEHMEYIQKLCLVYRQENMLVSYNDRSSYLVEPRTGMKKHVGMLEEVSYDDTLVLKQYYQVEGRFYATVTNG